MSGIIHYIESKLNFWFTPLVFLSLVCVPLYINTFQAPFTLDDFSSIVNNYSIRNPLDFSGMWHFYANRIIVYYTFSADYLIHNTDVVGYHIVNILIHILNGFILYLLMKNILALPYFYDLGINTWKNTVSLFAALIFLVHPVQINAVTYIVQRTASLETFFYMSAVLLFMKFRIKKNNLFYVLMLFSIVCAMFTKENAFTLPIVLLISEFIFFQGDREISWKSRFLIFVPIIITFSIIPCTNIFLGGFNASDPSGSIKASTDMDRFEYLYTEFNVVRTYLKLLVFPISQNFDYDYPITKTLFDVPTMLSILLHATLISFAIMQYKRNKLICYGILWFYVTLSIESSIISIQDVIFEHRLNLAMPGFCIFIAGVFFYGFNCDHRINKKRLVLFSTFCCIGIIFFSILTVNRNYIFSDNIRLWSDTVSKSPGKSRPHSILASNYMDNGQYDKAMEEFKIALDLSPGNYTARTNLAKCYNMTGNYGLAIETAMIAVSDCPSVYSYNNLAYGYFQQGQYSVAADYYYSGYLLDPQMPFILKGLGDSYFELGDYYYAQKYYSEFLKLNKNEKENIDVNIRLKQINQID